MSEIGSPGIMHDVDLTIEYTPTTPRQSINSPPTTPRQRTYDAFEVPPWDITNPLHGLHVVQVDDEHFFARWRYTLIMTMELPWFWNIRSESTDGLVPERETIILCRYIVFEFLCAMALRIFISSEDIDLIIYIYHDPRTKTVSVRFTTEGMEIYHLQHRPMGFELVKGRGVQMCKFAHWEPWMIGFHEFSPKLLGWDLVIADRSGLQRFTWPTNDGDVQRARFFTSHFGHGADGW